MNLDRQDDAPLVVSCRVLSCLVLSGSVSSTRIWSEVNLTNATTCYYECDIV